MCSRTSLLSHHVLCKDSENPSQDTDFKPSFCPWSSLSLAAAPQIHYMGSQLSGSPCRHNGQRAVLVVGGLWGQFFLGQGKEKKNRAFLLVCLCSVSSCARTVRQRSVWLCRECGDFRFHCILLAISMNAMCLHVYYF